MSKTTKAVLLSAFVCPGAGHIFLKKYIPGGILAGVSLAALYYLFSKALESALQISEKIQNGEVQLDVATLTELVSRQSTGAEAQLLNIATAALITCWLIGIIDSYRAARARDKNRPGGG